MKRRRFFETLTAALLAVLIGTVLAAPAMAQGNSGKNKDKEEDGSGDGPTFVDPGVRYAVELVDLPVGAVSAILFGCNDAGQVVGEAFIDGVSRALLIESSGTSGSSYVLDEITDGVPPNHVIRRATAINDAGLISVYRDDTSLEGLQLYPGIVDTHSEIPQFYRIPTTDSGHAVATDINNEGDVLILALDDNARILGDMYLFNHGLLHEELKAEELELILRVNDAPTPRLSDRLPIGGSHDLFVIGNGPYPFRYNISTGEDLELAIEDDGAGTTITFVTPFPAIANSWGDFMGNAITRTRHTKNGRLLSSTRTSFLQQLNGELDISYPEHAFSLNDSLDIIGLDFVIHEDTTFSIFDLLDPEDPGTDVLLQNAERLTLELLTNRIMEDSDFPVVYGRVVFEDETERVVILTPFPTE